MLQKQYKDLQLLTFCCICLILFHLYTYFSEPFESRLMPFCPAVLQYVFPKKDLLFYIRSTVT